MSKQDKMVAHLVRDHARRTTGLPHKPHQQEEIREGIKGWLIDEGACDNEDCLKDFSCTFDRKSNSYSCPYLVKMANRLLDYLHSQGVVIKVEREFCPSPYVNACPEDIGFNHCRNIHTRAGCGFFESLIEEDKDEC